MSEKNHEVKIYNYLTRLISSKQIPYVAIVASLIFAIPICLLIFNTIRLNEREKFREQFTEVSRERAAAIADALESSIDGLRSLAAIYQAFEDVSRDAFDVFASSVIQRHPSIQALEWVPLVTKDERAQYEASGAVYKKGFQFTELDEHNQSRPAQESDEYLPVFYVVPYAGNERALGLNLNSNIVRKQALAHARSTGSIMASSRIKLVQETAGQYSVL
jgi:CHASE1-domain containing sensor protein